MIIGAGRIAVIGHIDQAQSLAVDLAQEVAEHSSSLRRQGLLTGLGHVTELPRPKPLPSALHA